MQTLTKIDDYPNFQELLSDGNWRKSNYYEACCYSELWGCAFYISIDKKVTNIANEAIVYQLERLVIEGEGWDGYSQDIKADGFITVLNTGYIADYLGSNVTIEDFWMNYEEIINGISNSPRFKLVKNGIEVENSVLLKKEDIQGVVSFINKWNERQYFVETNSEWIFFSWCTGV